MYSYTRKNHIQAKKSKKMIYRFKMAAKLPIFMSRHFISANIWKNTFPKEFFDEIWLIIGDNEYIYNTEMKIEKFYSMRF